MQDDDAYYRDGLKGFTFTGLWEQTPGNPLVQLVWRGATPIDALVRQWATAFPDAKMSSPLRCEQDGHIYHLDLSPEGHREITVKARALQSVIETF